MIDITTVVLQALLFSKIHLTRDHHLGIDRPIKFVYRRVLRTNDILQLSRVAIKPKLCVPYFFAGYFSIIFLVVLILFTINLTHQRRLSLTRKWRNLYLSTTLTSILSLLVI